MTLRTGGRGRTWAIGSRLLRTLALVVGRLPDSVGVWLGRGMGDVAAVLLRRRRRIALDNLRIAFPHLGARARRRLHRRSWQHAGTSLVELCRVLARPLDATLATVSVDGLAHVTAVMREHGRALVLTAHLGNWELLPMIHRLAGHPCSIVVRRLDAGWADGLVEAARAKAGVALIDKRGAVRPVLDALRSGRIVAILLDQNATRRESVFVPFFGHPASTSRSLALVAIRTRTPIVPIFIRREASGRHRVTIHPPLMPGAADDEPAIVDLTARCTRLIEDAIRSAPEQWLWIHRRWRTRSGATA